MDGKITVHSPDRFDELFGENSDTRTRSDSVPGKDERVVSPVARASSTSPAVQMKRIEEWLSRKASRNAVSLPDDKDLSAIKEVCQSISDRENDLFADIGKFINSQAEHNQSKKEMLYKKWKERVFDPIHDKLSTHMDLSYPQLDSRKRALFTEYLAYRAKHTVFLDTMNKDYNPLSWTHDDVTLKVVTGSLDDPLLQQSRALETDKLVLTSCDTGMKAALTQQHPPLGREDTDALLWLAMELVYIDSEARVRSRKGMSGSHNLSHLAHGVGTSSEGGRDTCHIPHRRTITYPRKPLKLEWKEPVIESTTYTDGDDENDGKADTAPSTRGDQTE